MRGRGFWGLRVRYIVGGPKTLTELRRARNHMAKGLFSEATKAAIRNLKERPSGFTIEMNIGLPVYDIDDKSSCCN